MPTTRYAGRRRCRAVSGTSGQAEAAPSLSRLSSAKNSARASADVLSSRCSRASCNASCTAPRPGRACDNGRTGTAAADSAGAYVASGRQRSRTSRCSGGTRTAGCPCASGRVPPGRTNLPARPGTEGTQPPLRSPRPPPRRLPFLPGDSRLAAAASPVFCRCGSA